MAQSIEYDGNPLTIVRLDDTQGAPEWVEAADHGRIGEGSMTIDDVAGTQLLRGHKLVTVEEDECAFPRTLTAYVGPKKFRRGSGKTGPSRIITPALLDLNARLTFKVIHGTGSHRPVEEVGERIDWLLGTSALSGLVSDFGFVGHPTTEVDDNKYQGQYPEDVLRDCALAVGFNFFVYWDDDEDAAGLWFKDSNTSTDFTSTLSFSNVIEDVDDNTTFYVGGDAEFEEDPSQVISGNWKPYERGNVYRVRSATAAVFEPRDGVTPAANVKRRARARAIADRELFARRNEEVSATETVILPATKINLIRAGQRAQFRHSFMGPEGFDQFSWFRILETRKRPMVAPDEQLYSVNMTISPTEGGCSVTPTRVQYKWQESDPQLGDPNWTYRLSLDAPSNPGNLIGVAMIGDDLNTGTMVSTPTGWHSTFLNLNMKADDSGDWCHLIWKKSQGESYVDVRTTGSARGPRGMFFEYAGLTNPTQSGSYSFNREVGLGYANAAATSYPSGATAVVAICFMHTGPESGDALAASGTGLTLWTVQDSGAPGFFGSPCIGIADNRRAPGAGSGTTPVFPAAGGWQFQFTNDEETMVVGIAFTGDQCE